MFNITENRPDFISFFLLKIRFAKYNFQIAHQILKLLQLNFIYKNTLI